MERLERLWTPWRAEYVTATPRTDEDTPAETECFFCENPQLNTDGETFILHRGETSYVLLNLYPYNTGHLMVAPYDHGGDLLALPEETSMEMLSLTRKGIQGLTEEYRPEGFNVGMNIGRPAGAGAPDHLHMHVVPRWTGDTNFMPITSGTKVLPETLQQTYARLRPHFSA